MRLEQDVQFADEEDVVIDSPTESWKVLIVDDEEEVHHLTKMVLHDFYFCDKHLVFYSAYSEQEAFDILQLHPDIALVLLDVVMEKEDSGLRLVRRIRNELGNSWIRIIMRTAQPGQAPERQVIMEYDINDYKEKTELTSQKLFTAVVSALRSYRDLMIINEHNRGLEDIIRSSASFFEVQTSKKFASSILSHLTSLLHINEASRCNSCIVEKNGQNLSVLATEGSFSENGSLQDVVDRTSYQRIEKAFDSETSEYGADYITLYFCTKSGMEKVIYIEGVPKVTMWERRLLDIYCANVSVAFENINLNEEFEKTQKEIIFTLGSITESRSKETSNHVKRVAEYSKLLAREYGLSEDEAELVRLASPMHDVGKVAVPDAILNKPGKLTDEEYDIIKQHATHGYNLLNHSKRSIIRAGAIIAHEHHEKYNGRGYPNGLSGEDIHIYARITAIADVFDALSSDRVYKKAWPLEDILAYFQKERGEHFDPKLVDLFFAHLSEILEIRERYFDEKKD